MQWCHRRPHLVMQSCSGPGFAQRSCSGTFDDPIWLCSHAADSDSRSDHAVVPSTTPFGYAVMQQTRNRAAIMQWYLWRSHLGMQSCSGPGFAQRSCSGAIDDPIWLCSHAADSDSRSDHAVVHLTIPVGYAVVQRTRFRAAIMQWYRQPLHLVMQSCSVIIILLHNCSDRTEHIIILCSGISYIQNYNITGLCHTIYANKIKNIILH
jgi:hypothetical protein